MKRGACACVFVYTHVVSILSQLHSTFYERSAYVFDTLCAYQFNYTPVFRGQCVSCDDNTHKNVGAKFGTK